MRLLLSFIVIIIIHCYYKLERTNKITWNVLQRVILCKLNCMHSYPIISFWANIVLLSIVLHHIVMHYELYYYTYRIIPMTLHSKYYNNEFKI